VRTLFVHVLAAALLGSGVLGTIASGRASSRPQHPATITVRPGDTLWLLAVRYYAGRDPRAAAWTIAEANGIHGALLRPGQRLRLP
jgi:nucleoid-associated protein YgaU